ncbi:hypothetical protein FG386_002149 [Cryptosporidium ryanae]|uniref:uncharacterized protein n=1 Tax=Cryptosporidium ryanae TaxID=515981 RepID=UPI00351A14A7|nr:hypothetical protein FG386_002149 [Cryptosporidium ryanae]
MSNFMPLTRGQRKRREALERVRRKQDLTNYLLKQRQLEKLGNLSATSNTGINKKRLYNFNKIKNHVDDALSNNDTDEANIGKNNMSRKKIQKLRENSIGYMKEILDHPDFGKLEDMKSRLLFNIENDPRNNLLNIFSKNKTKRNKDKKRSLSNNSKKMVKVTKLITK